MPKPDKNYDEDFKRQAVGLYANGTASLAQVARELGVSTNSLRNWRKQLLDEVRRLRKQVRHLERQQEILKKAAVILGTDPHTSGSR